MREAARVTDEIVTFSVDNKADFRPSLVETTASGSTVVEIDGDRFEVPVFGCYQVYNLMAAYAIVRTLGFDFSRADIESIDLTTAPMRGETSTVGGVTVIADCYNANPDSVKAGLQSFAQLPSGGRRAVVLGDMLELGDDAEEYHRQMGKQVAAAKCDRAFLVGPLSEQAAEAAVEAGMDRGAVAHFASAAECAEVVISWLESGDMLYLKGSRGIGLEEIITRWQEEGKVA
jgi:UDP-N-acetylmuramoyl-tripeptide--D-alanyl-D-alanine ligase